MTTRTSNDKTKHKRLCFFAGYDKNGIIRDYVIYYIQELSKLCDVFYVGDFDASDAELQKLSDITIGRMATRHKTYDFGSWMLAFKANKNILSQYDELVLVNDSCYGPIFPLEEVFSQMDAKALDAWSICGNHFLMSFFVVMKQKIFLSPEFEHFITNISHEKEKSLIIKKYERGLDNLIREKTDKFGIYCSKEKLKEFYKNNKKQIKEMLKSIPFLPRILIKIRPQKIRLYEDSSLLLLMMHFPLIKKIYFLGNNYTMKYYFELLGKYTDYPVNLIKDNLEKDFYSKSNWWCVLLNNIKNSLKGFFFIRMYKGNKYIIKVCKIPVYIKTNNYKF